MTTVDQIEKAVQALSDAELARFRAWFELFDQAHLDDAVGTRANQIKASIAQYERGDARDGFEVIGDLKKAIRRQSGG